MNWFDCLWWIVFPVLFANFLRKRQFEWAALSFAGWTLLVLKATGAV